MPKKCGKQLNIEVKVFEPYLQLPELLSRLPPALPPSPTSLTSAGPAPAGPALAARPAPAAGPAAAAGAAEGVSSSLQVLTDTRNRLVENIVAWISSSSVLHDAGASRWANSGW